MTHTNPLSKCCNAPVEEEVHKIWEGTRMYRCRNCGKPCTTNTSAAKNTREYIENKKREGLYGIDPSLIVMKNAVISIINKKLEKK